MATRNFSDYDKSKVPNAENMCFGIVVSERNPEITNALLEGTVTTLEGFDALPDNHVPLRFKATVFGSYEAIVTVLCFYQLVCYLLF